MEIALPALLTRNDPLQGADFEAGIILPVDKPAALSSFDVVHRIRRWCRVRKVGHSGTLDPAATGLLLLLTGKATRQQSSFMRLDKEYLATILLGVETNTWDLDGEIIARRQIPEIRRETIVALLNNQFTGEFEQTPPAFSALKVGGVPSYRLARRGQASTPTPRRVIVHGIELQAWAPPEFTIKLSCSSGFYVRSLAQDVGQSLACGAVLKKLIRTRIGDYRLEDAWRLDELEQILKTQQLTKSTCPS